MARGGARPGGGRPKKADEERIRTWAISAMVKVFGSEEGAFMKLAEIAQKAKSDKDKIAAISKIMEYGFGKPTQTMDISSETRLISIDPIQWTGDGKPKHDYVINGKD